MEQGHKYLCKIALENRLLVQRQSRITGNLSFKSIMLPLAPSCWMKVPTIGIANASRGDGTMSEGALVRFLLSVSLEHIYKNLE